MQREAESKVSSPRLLTLLEKTGDLQAHTCKVKQLQENQAGAVEANQDRNSSRERRRHSTDNRGGGHHRRSATPEEERRWGEASRKTESPLDP